MVTWIVFLSFVSLSFCVFFKRTAQRGAEKGGEGLRKIEQKGYPCPSFLPHRPRTRHLAASCNSPKARRKESQLMIKNKAPGSQKKKGTCNTPRARSKECT
ncbi:hypothetical protein OIU79_002390 [Salix purpurea]|uniref:Secreted protein n=1 Tax=Salix purpurea TaxID=77065 RepID=A0A9Q0USE6_SALPP|nr:hypothetical protein OIU79_002390 [Salix purpurea]